MSRMVAPQGRAYWAVAPFAPEPPFRLYAGEGGPPVDVADARRMRAAAEKVEQHDFTLLMSVKPRPILVISTVLPPYDEVIALRLKRLNTLSDSAAERVREGTDDGLFSLPPDDFPGLELENAAIVTSMLRLPLSALDTSSELGVINQQALVSLHERVASSVGLRLDLQILRKSQELLREIGLRMDR
jgi:hypothetical protein